MADYHFSRTLIVIGFTGAIAAVVAACGTDAGNELDDSSSGFPEQGFGSNNDDSPDADVPFDPYANDPPPPWCGPGSDPAPPPPGGTLECPDDKNKPGCSCKTAGEKAPCWTGLRKHRGVGVCKDGETTCVAKGEFSLVWSECTGQVLPTPGATEGSAACACFSSGEWKIANSSPCFVTYNGETKAISTTPNGQCPRISGPPTSAPSESWSTNTVKVDCAGHFKLCARIRQGKFDAPSPSDCIVGEVCAEADYKEPNVEQPWPNLPGWIGSDTACAKKWAAVPATQSAGYLEMLVKGKSVRCDTVDDGSGGDLVFNRLQYCPMSCVTNPSSSPLCATCGPNSRGEF